MNAKTSPYRAVSITPGLQDCCKTVAGQTGTRYLSQEAPLLPLADCTQPQQCSCKYEHWQDRRQEDRRAAFSGMGSQYYASSERREREDRRKNAPF